MFPCKGDFKMIKYKNTYDQAHHLKKVFSNYI